MRSKERLMSTLRARKPKSEEWETRLGTSGFNPLDVLELQDAVRNREHSVHLTDSNQTLILTYKVRSDGEVVHYKPERGFVPIGTLNIDHLLRGL